MIQHTGFDYILHYLGFMIITILFEHPFMVASFFVIFPSLLWKKSWFITYSVLLGTFFFVIWAVDTYQKTRPESIGHGSPGDAFGYALFMLLTLGYGAGFILRFVVYAGLKFIGSLKSKNLTNYSSGTG
jgi:hypothetical protein